MNIKRIIFTIGLLASASCFADTPLRPPEAKRFCDVDVSHCGYTDPASGTDIYKVEGNFKLTKLYSIDGWHRSPHLSPNGVYFVSGYYGLNLVPVDAKSNLVMLVIYKNGKPHSAVTLGDLILDMKNLRRTVSHQYWGSIQAVNDDVAVINTVEGNVAVSLENGSVKRLN